MLKLQLKVTNCPRGYWYIITVSHNEKYCNLCVSYDKTNLSSSDETSDLVRGEMLELFLYYLTDRGEAPGAS